MSDQTAEASKFIPNLETAVTQKYFFLLAVYTLWVDSALIKIQGQGLLDYAQNPEGLKASFALAVFLLFVLFSFLMALIMPLLIALINDVVLNFVWQPWAGFCSWLAGKFDLEQRVASDTGPGMNYVLLNELRKKAHATQESYYLNLLKAEEDLEKSRGETNAATRFFAGSALVVATYNFCFQSEHSLLNRCTLFLGDRGWGWAVLLLLAVNAFGFFFTSHNTRWAYCPSLWREQQDAKPKAAFLPLPHRSED